MYKTVKFTFYACIVAIWVLMIIILCSKNHELNGILILVQLSILVIEFILGFVKTHLEYKKKREKVNEHLYQWSWRNKINKIES